MASNNVSHRFRSLNAQQFVDSLAGTVQGQTVLLGTFANTAKVTIGTSYVQGMLSNTVAKVTFYSNTAGQLIVSNVSSTAGFSVGEGIRIRKTNGLTGTLIGNSHGGIVSTVTPSNPTVRYYMFVGKPLPWTDENIPPAIAMDTQDEQFDYYRDMIAMKRIQVADVSYAAARYNWAANTVYAQYDDEDTMLMSKEFYVITSNKNIYKCIDNNYGANSVTQPSGTSTAVISTADGYRWKYMFTVSDADYQKFASSGYIPVKTLMNNDSSAQWAVQQASTNGSINHIKVANSGQGFYLVTNAFASVVNSTAFTLGSYASGGDHIYANSSIFISSGLGAGQIRKILSYTGATKKLVVNNAFSPIPNTSSKFIISPTVIIRGDSGKNISDRATAYVSLPMNQVGGFSRITLITNGFNYSTANVLFDSYAGSGAEARPIISPPGIHGAGGNHGQGGHGSDAVGELYAYNVILSVKITGTEGNTFPSNNDFRQIGILRDPLLASGTSNYANVASIDLTNRLTVASVSGAGDFRADEIIKGLTSKVEGRLVVFANTNAARSQGILKLVRIATDGGGGFFTAGETVQGQSSGKTAVISSFCKSAIKPYTGDVIYIKNIVPVTRSSDQIESIKVLVKF